MICLTLDFGTKVLEPSVPELDEGVEGPLCITAKSIICAKIRIIPMLKVFHREKPFFWNIFYIDLQINIKYLKNFG